MTNGIIDRLLSLTFELLDMDKQSIRKIIKKAESLSVDDQVKFEDASGIEYKGKIVELQSHQHDRHEDNLVRHKDYLVKGSDGTQDCVLEVWYDVEGGPTHVQVSFEDDSEQDVTALKIDD